MRITVAAQNLKEGGWGRLDPDQPPQPDFDRLPALCDRLAAAAADIIVLSEIRDQRPYHEGSASPADHLAGCEADRQRMDQAASSLSMALAGITPSRAGIPSAVLYRPGRLRLTGWHDRFSTWFTNGSGLAAFAIDGCDQTLAVATVHADPWSTIDTQRELQRTVALVSEFHDWGVAAGDFNCAPVYGPHPAAAILRPHHRMNHLADPSSGARGPNLAPARALEEAGYVDAAAVLDACAPAPGEDPADLIERCRTGRTGRIDRIHLTPALAPTPVAYRRLDQGRYASDHYGVATTLDLSRALEDNPRRPGHARPAPTEQQWN